MNSLKRVLADLDTVLHERGRLAIVAVLAAVEDLTFTELRDELAMTDGNLSVHLQKLEEKGYVGISKHFVGRRHHAPLSIVIKRLMDRITRVRKFGISLQVKIARVITIDTNHDVFIAHFLAALVPKTIQGQQDLLLLG